MDGFKKLAGSSTFVLIAVVMAITAIVASQAPEFTWKDWVAQLDMYITGYVVKEAVRYGSAAYQNKGVAQ